MKSTRIHKRLKESLADTAMAAAPHAAGVGSIVYHVLNKKFPRKKGKISPETKKFVRDLRNKTKKEPLSD